MSDSKDKQFTGVLVDSDDGEMVIIEQSPELGMLIAKGKNKVALWPDQLAKMIKAYQAWES